MLLSDPAALTHTILQTQSIFKVCECVCFAMLFSEDRPACFTREVRTFLVKWVILSGLSEGSGLVKSFSLQPGSGSGDVWESPHIDRSTKVCVF